MSIETYLDLEPQIAEQSYIAPSACVIGNVEISRKVSIWPNVVLRGDINLIRIGEYSNVQDGCTIHVDADKPAIIGSYVTIGHNAIVHACVIEDNCLIGMGSIILDGARIGTGSIIGAGSVIPPGKVIPPRSLVMGVPGKVVKEIDNDRVAGNVTHAAKYWNLALNYIEPESTEGFKL